MSSPPCPTCGTALGSGDRFCAACGAPVGAAGRPRPVWPWALAVTFTALAGAAWLWQTRRLPTPVLIPTPDATGGAGVPAPDISALTPRQAFDRLYGRAMDAAARNDTAAVLRLSQHALDAYRQVDSLDPDGWYHAAVLYAQVGGHEAALALADTILARAPGHLLGHLIRGTVAQLRGDRTALAAARRAFLEAWVVEPGTGRVEYLDHQQLLQDFRREAEAARLDPP